MVSKKKKKILLTVSLKRFLKSLIRDKSMVSSSSREKQILVESHPFHYNFKNHGTDKQLCALSPKFLIEH